MKYLTKLLLAPLILCLMSSSAFAQYDIENGLTHHEDELVPSINVEINYDNLPRLQYAWENYLERKLTVTSDTLLDEEAIPTTSFTGTTVDLYTQFVRSDSAIYMKLYADYGNGYFLSPFEDARAYKKMKRFTNNFLEEFAFDQRKQRMTELQLKVDYLQQEILKYQAQNEIWERNIQALVTRMEEDQQAKTQLLQRMKRHAKQLRKLENALNHEQRLLRKLMKKKDMIPSTTSIPK
ncbi:MAG: hypothetical protein ACPGJS_02080 [Flammeovirgaceae bacterium]